MSIDFLNHPNAKDKSAKEKFAFFKEKFAPIAGTDKGVLFDIIQARFYAQQLTELNFFTDVEKQELRNVFKDKPAYAQALISENDRLAAQIAAIEENKESIKNETPDVSQEQMLDAILAKHRGKTVVVDFWATWCGPCLYAMETIKPLKDEMKGKDVVWVYLTGETSPLANWTLTYPTISGEHYRVSEEQWNYWLKTYGMEGIPTYMVFDRDGTELSKHSGFPGVDALKVDIETAE